MNGIEDVRRATLKRTRNQSLLQVDEASNRLYIAHLNNDRFAEKQSNKIKQDPDESSTPTEKGLPPQPQRYLKYPDYDWF